MGLDQPRLLRVGRGDCRTLVGAVGPWAAFSACSRGLGLSCSGKQCRAVLTVGKPGQMSKAHSRNMAGGFQPPYHMAFPRFQVDDAN